MGKPKPETRFDDFPRPTWRRRLLGLGLAIATAITIVLTLLYPPGGVKRKAPPPPPDAARCEPGQTAGCVGGTAVMIVPPAAGPASAPR